MSINLKVDLRNKQEKIDNKIFIPAVLYGNKVKNINFQIKKTDFDRLWQEAGESNLINLNFGEQTAVVVIKDVQYDPVKYRPIHVDFYQVNMKEKITTEIPLNFVGESKAVRELGGLLMKYTDAVEVKCLPGDLANQIEVDISPLDSFEKSIHMKDLVLPLTMELMRDPEEIVVSVIPPKTSAEIEAEEVAEKAISDKTSKDVITEVNKDKEKVGEENTSQQKEKK